MRFAPASLLLLGVICAASAARAQDHPRSAADEVPSAFAYGFRGFLVGAGVGLAGGYLVARDDGFEDGDWKPLTYGAGIGALAGGALGLTLGLVDMANHRRGGGHLVLRDTVYGTAFGATAGAIAGALAAISTEEAEHIVLGAAIGALAGTALGVVLGIFDANRLPSESARADRTWTLTVEPTRAVDGKLVWGPALVGRY